MFTPNKKRLPPFPMPVDRKSKFVSSLNPRSPRVWAVGEGKSELAALGQSSADAHMAEVEAWKTFREAGLLDESEMRRKDREALVQRIQELEKELHDYQYHMGLLLIEREKRASEYEEMSQKVAKTERIIKQEQKEYLIAISKLEKREENIHKALMVNNHRVKDLEEIMVKRSSEADANWASDNKVIKAIPLPNDALEHLETKGKQHLSDAGLSEVTWDMEVVDIKQKELEAVEARLQNVYTYITGKRGHGEHLACQRDDAQPYEQRLLDRPLDDGHLFSIGREDDGAIQRARLVKSEELEEKEDDISIRLQNSTTKEKVVGNKQLNLETQEKDLLIRGEKLSAGQRVEIEKLLDDHKLSLDCKKQESELELEKKRRSFEEELSEKLDALEKKSVEINYREDENLARESVLENKMKKLNDKEKEINTRLRLFKETEESINQERKKLEDGKEQLAIYIQMLVSSKFQSLKAAYDTERQEITREKENLKLAQLEVKEKMDNYRSMSESLLMESDNLIQEKNKIYKELELRKETLETEQKQLNHDREAFNEWRLNEHEKLRNERLKMKADIQQEVEELRLKKDTLGKERSDFSQVEEMQKLWKEGNGIKSGVSEDCINFFDELNSQKLKKDEDWLAGEPREIFTKRRKMETDCSEMQNVDIIPKNLGSEQEEFIKVQGHLPVVAKQFGFTQHFGVTVNKSDSLGLQTPSRITAEMNILPEEHVDGSHWIDGHFPALCKCPVLSGLSAEETLCHPIEGSTSKPSSPDGEDSETKLNYESYRDKFEIGVRDSGLFERLCKNEDEPEACVCLADTNIRKSKTKPSVSSSDLQDRGCETESQSLSTEQIRRHQTSRRGRHKTINKSNSMGDAAENCEFILGEIKEEKAQQTREGAEDLVYIDNGSRGDLIPGDRLATSADQMQHSFHGSAVTTGQLAFEGGEAFHENVAEPQISSPGTPTSGGNRYNFRPSTINRRTRT